MKSELQLLGDNRLKNVLALDKRENPNKITNVLKSELLNVLRNYMDIRSEDVEFNICVNPQGNYSIQLVADIKRLKVASYIM